MQQQMKPKEQGNQQQANGKANEHIVSGRLESEPEMEMQHTIGNHGLLRRYGLPIQAKLKVSDPNDEYEQEADRVAEAVMRIQDLQEQRYVKDGEETVQAALVGELATPLVTRQTEIGGGLSIQPNALPGQVDETVTNIGPQVSALQGKGKLLPSSVRTIFEQRFGVNFSGVRVHTDAQAAEIAGVVNAKAFTVGQDIVFGRQQYQPTTEQGKHLLAHELCHVLQQSPSLPTLQTKNERITRKNTVQHNTFMIMRLKDLGYESWSTPFGVVKNVVYVGTEEDWKEILSKADNEEAYRKYLQGFLEIISDPGKVGRERHPHGWRDYRNSIMRVPTREEIMAFMRALYNLGGNLSLKPGLLGGGAYLYELENNLNMVIGKYQGEIIKELSANKAGSRVVDQIAIKSVADMSGKKVRETMIKSSITTAVEGLGLLVIAIQEKNDQKKDIAYTIISNAGTVMRHTLDINKSKLEDESAVNLIVIDALFSPIDSIPVVGTILRRLREVKKLLTKTINKMISKATEDNDPAVQGYNIADEFENSALNMGPNGSNLIGADDVSQAISRFKSSLAVK